MQSEIKYIDGCKVHSNEITLPIVTNDGKDYKFIFLLTQEYNISNNKNILYENHEDINYMVSGTTEYNLDSFEDFSGEIIPEKIITSNNLISKILEVTNEEITYIMGASIIGNDIDLTTGIIYVYNKTTGQVIYNFNKNYINNNIGIFENNMVIHIDNNVNIDRGLNISPTYIHHKINSNTYE